MKKTFSHHKTVNEQSIIKKCHVCGQVTESHKELDKCPNCSKAFLPLNYFGKVHTTKNSEEYSELFEVGENLHEDDLIKGIYVLW